MEISGKSNIEIIKKFSKTKLNTNDYLKKLIKNIIVLLLKIKKGSFKKFDYKNIICFVPRTKDTSEGIKLLYDTINNKHKDLVDFYNCAELYSGIDEEKKQFAVSKGLPSDKIKIIFATNVAESSITVDGLLFCIDTGLEI